MLYIGADHRGYNLKEALKKYLEELSNEFSARGGPALGWEDMGALSYDPNDDYPDYALAVAKKVADRPEAGQPWAGNRGILICGAGVGVDIVANKIKGIRSALVSEVAQAKASRNDDNTNILSLASDFITEERAKEIIKIWLETPYGRLERYERRLNKIKQIEKL